MSKATLRRLPEALNPVCVINQGRPNETISEIAKIGALDGGGCCRLALSDGDRAARDLFARWCRESGCEVKADAFGNMFAFRKGRNPAAPIVLTGSHLDTQPHGGHLDGIYGVLAGLEVMRALNDAGIETDSTIAVVNWTNEEGVRYAPGLTGSSAFFGHLPAADALAIVGTDGSVYGEELKRIGYAGDLDPAGLKIRAYIEAHIEQGPVLERLGKPIGAVIGIQGVRWFEVTVESADRHAGTTPMDDRQDSFMAAARYVTGNAQICAGDRPGRAFHGGAHASRTGFAQYGAGRDRFHDRPSPSGRADFRVDRAKTSG
jgi:beta-ureidopropionase / N-carbamoyl-L-amino-acid hydrolase